jgi:hypothetical protein
MRAAPPFEREALLADRFYLWENAFARAMLFGTEETGDFWLDAMRPEDRDEVMQLETTWQDEFIPRFGTLRWPPTYTREGHLAFHRAVLGCPGVRVRIARDRDGRAIGYNAILPVTTGSLDVLLENPHYGPAVRAHFGRGGLAAVPSDPEHADTYCLIQSIAISATPDVVLAALFRDLFSVLARGKAYVVCMGFPDHKQLLGSLGFVHLPDTPGPSWLAEWDFEGFVLDLRRTGVEPWIEAIVAGRRPPRVLRLDEATREVRRVLAHWSDDAALAASPLLDLPALAPPEASAPGRAAGPAALRALVRRTVAEIEAGGSEPDRLACRAVALAHLGGSNGPVNADAAAAELAVSRRTYYRLLARGASLLVERLVGGPPSR